MSTTICQVMGFLVSLLGIGGSIMATAMDTWSTQDLYDNPVTAVFQYQGLWRSCVRQSSGFTECRPYFTILGLPGRGKNTPAVTQGFSWSSAQFSSERRGRYLKALSKELLFPVLRYERKNRSIFVAKEIFVVRVFGGG